MKKLLFGVILGLFAFVHSSPLTTVTQISAKAEDDVLKEAATDGFLVNPVTISNESQKPRTTAPVPELPSVVPSQMFFEGSGLGESSNLDEGEDHENKTQNASHAPNSTLSPAVADDSNAVKTTTQSSGESGDLVQQQEDDPLTNTTESVSDGPSLVSTESPKVTENSSSSITQSPGESFGHEDENQGTNAPSLTTTMVQGIMDNSGSESTTTNSSGESSDLFHQHESEEIRTTMPSVSEAPGQDTTVFLRAVDHSISGSSDTHSSEDSSEQPDGEHQDITTPSVSHTPSQKANVPLPDNDDPVLHPASTPSQNNDLFNIPSFSTPSSLLEDDPFYNSFLPNPFDEGSGFGDDEKPDQDTNTTSSETSTTNATMAAPIRPGAPRIFEVFERAEAPKVRSEGGSNVMDNELQPENEKPGVSGNQEPHTDETSQKGHKTPGWMIIVGFIVGVAALIVLCVAIATRDKWNKPNKPSIFETQVSTTNQPREQEMETFLPRENGKASEYTVIPLEELPDKYSSD